MMPRPEERNQAERDPDRGGDDRNAGKNIARLRAERTRTTHAAERTREAAAAAALHEHEQDEENCQKR
jgi:hypothetical protein